MGSGFWVVCVDRATGKATTLPRILDQDEAYQRSIDIEDQATYTTVVPRRVAHTKHTTREQNSRMSDTDDERELPDTLIEGLLNYAKSIIFEAAGSEGDTISIAELDGDRCTVIVRDPDGAASTAVLPLSTLAALVDTAGRWLAERQSTPRRNDA